MVTPEEGRGPCVVRTKADYGSDQGDDVVKRGSIETHREKEEVREKSHSGWN